MLLKLLYFISIFNFYFSPDQNPLVDVSGTPKYYQEDIYQNYDQSYTIEDAERMIRELKERESLNINSGLSKKSLNISQQDNYGINDQPESDVIDGKIDIGASVQKQIQAADGGVKTIPLGGTKVKLSDVSDDIYINKGNGVYKKNMMRLELFLKNL